MSKGDEVLAQVRDWKADGVILGLERRCRPSSLGGLSRMAEIQRAGVPAVDIDPSTADPRELNIPAALKTLDAFMEGMGLRPIGESRAAKTAPAGDGND
jgi:benzoyl-CoA reductase/2-hydroxyglutaryl-CoA dehydratase subunit BcrC/BadD/HgdB